MNTIQISLDHDAYERLEAEKRDGESFSDAVRRLTAGVDLADYHSVLSEGTAEALDTVVRDRREIHTGARLGRLEESGDAFDETDE